MFHSYLRRREWRGLWVGVMGCVLCELLRQYHRSEVLFKKMCINKLTLKTSERLPYPSERATSHSMSIIIVEYGARSTVLFFDVACAARTRSQVRRKSNNSFLSLIPSFHSTAVSARCDLHLTSFPFCL